MGKIRTILMALAVSAVTFAAVAGTNAVIATEKCQSASSASVVAVSGDVAFDRAVRAELKAAASDAKEEYEKRYKELKTAHDDFMLQLNISLGIIAVLVAIFGAVFPMFYQWRISNDLKEYHRTLEGIYKTGSDLKKSQALSSVTMMKFVWVEFLHSVTLGSVTDRDIAQPIYRITETLKRVYELGDSQFLCECIDDIAQIARLYDEVVGGKKGEDANFKKFIKEHRICTESKGGHDLRISEAGKMDTLKPVLKFLNEFGITMFGKLTDD